MRIIVNADDLGMSEEVNEAIFEGMGRGGVTSATILANGAAVATASQNLQHFPKCSFGVHLNLTEFRPLCPDNTGELSKILDANGCFNGNRIREIRIGQRMLKAIFHEWCSQIEHLIRLGVRPSHFDAHHHVHTIPELLPVLMALRMRYRIDKVRMSRNMYDDHERPSEVLLAKKRLYNLALRAIGFRTTRIFTDLLTYVKLCGTRAPQAAAVELMTHPGSTPPGEEAKLLESGWPSRLSYQPDLISYDSL